MGGRGSAGASGGGGKAIKLTGSEKQVKWANQIIEDSQATLSLNIARLEKNLKTMGWGPESSMGKQLTKLKNIRTSFNKALVEIEKKPNSAAFVIDNRKNLDSGHILRIM